MFDQRRVAYKDDDTVEDVGVLGQDSFVHACKLDARVKGPFLEVIDYHL